MKAITEYLINNHIRYLDCDFDNFKTKNDVRHVIYKLSEKYRECNPKLENFFAGEKRIYMPYITICDTNGFYEKDKTEYESFINGLLDNKPFVFNIILFMYQEKLSN